MTDFHTTAIPMGGGMTPKTFNPSQMPTRLSEAPRARSSETMTEGGSLAGLVAQPYRAPHEKPKKQVVKEVKPAAKMTQNQAEHEDSHGGITLKTGGALVVEGARGLRRQVAKMVHHGKSTYAGLSHEDQHLYVDKLVKHARALTTGSKIGFTTKRNIKESLRADYLKGKITSTDVKKMNELTDTLH